MHTRDGGSAGGKNYVGSGFERPADADGLIQPLQFSLDADLLDTSNITSAASTLRSMGTKVDRQVGNIHEDWGGLSDSYEAPEAGEVYALMDDPKTAAEEFKQRCTDAADILDTYAGELDGIKSQLASFTQTAKDFRAKCENGVEVESSEVSTGAAMFDWVPGVGDDKVTVNWKEDGDTVDRNNELLEQYAGYVAKVFGYALTAYNDINKLCLNLDASQIEQIDAISAEQLVESWGPPVEEDRTCGESVAHGAYEFGKGTIQGLGQLTLGYNPETGDFFSGEAYGQAWKGLGDFALSTLVVTSPIGWTMMAVDSPIQDWARDRGMVAAQSWGSLVGIDASADDIFHKWKEDGVATGTESLLNVGTFFIPGAGAVGGALKAGSMGARMARIGARAADFAVPGGSWAVKGGVKVVTGLKGVDFDNLVRVTRGVDGDVQVPRGVDVDTRPMAETTPTRPVSGDMFGDGATPRPGGSGDVPAGRPLAPSPTTIDNAIPDNASRMPDGQPAPRAAEPSGVSGAGRPSPAGAADDAVRAGDGAGRPSPAGAADDAVRAGDAGDASPAGAADDAAHGGRPTSEEGALPEHLRDDPAHDPSHAHYDGTPRGEHGNIGTVDPDVPSESGLTNSGRLHDPDVVPEELKPYVADAAHPDRPIVNDNGVLRVRDQADLTFNITNKAHDAGEFARQVEMQQRSLNQQSLQNHYDNFSDYHSSGRSHAAEQRAYRNDWVDNRAETLESRGLSAEDARAQARSEASGQAVLHGPDQVAGGNPTQFTGLGDSRVNSALGWRWGQGGQTYELARQLDDIYGRPDFPPRELWGDIRMNVEINVMDARTTPPVAVPRVDLGGAPDVAPPAGAVADAPASGGVAHARPDADTAAPEGSTSGPERPGAGADEAVGEPADGTSSGSPDAEGSEAAGSPDGTGPGAGDGDSALPDERSGDDRSGARDEATSGEPSTATERALARYDAARDALWERIPPRGQESVKAIARVAEFLAGVGKSMSDKVETAHDFRDGVPQDVKDAIETATGQRYDPSILQDVYANMQDAQDAGVDADSLATMGGGY